MVNMYDIPILIGYSVWFLLIIQDDAYDFYHCSDHFILKNSYIIFFIYVYIHHLIKIVNKMLYNYKQKNILISKL